MNFLQVPCESTNSCLPVTARPLASRIYVAAASEDIAVRAGAAAIDYPSGSYQHAVMAAPFTAGPDEGIQLRPMYINGPLSRDDSGDSAIWQLTLLDKQH